MRHIQVTAPSGACEVVVGKGLGPLRRHLPAQHLLVADTAALAAHRPYLSDCQIVEVGGGEEVKTFSALEMLYKKFFEHELERSSTIVAFGGGAVCDLVGFAAATYLRGLSFIAVPTTLLAQVDASIGGKNGINFANQTNIVKNLIGTIRQPTKCICDIDLLSSLPNRDFLAGFAEIVKHAVIVQSSLLEILEQNCAEVINRDGQLLPEIVYRSIEIKKEIVEADEQEGSLRRILNFGHTIGHAIELSENLLHGEAVSIGMCLEAAFAVRCGKLASQDSTRIKDILEKLGLPTTTKTSRESVRRSIMHDKKLQSGKIMLPLLNGLGKVAIIPTTIDELLEVLPK